MFGHGVLAWFLFRNVVVAAVGCFDGCVDVFCKGLLEDARLPQGARRCFVQKILMGYGLFDEIISASSYYTTIGLPHHQPRGNPRPTVVTTVGLMWYPTTNRGNTSRAPMVYNSSTADFTRACCDWRIDLHHVLQLTIDISFVAFALTLADEQV